MGVHQRKGSPFWQYCFEIDAGKGGKGKRFRGSTKCTSRRDAEAFERAERERRQAEIASAAANLAAPDTVDEVFARYWAAHGHKLAWAGAVRDHMAEMLAFFGPTRAFCDLSGADIAGALEDFQKNTQYNLRGGKKTRVGKPVTDSTVNRRLAVIRAIHNKAKDEWELPVRHIVWKKYTRKEPKERVRHITLDQAKLALRKLPQHILLMAAFTLSTGCRLNEAETLMPSRVNFETRQAEVNTKGGGTRFVDLSAAALSVLACCDLSRPLVFDATNRRKLWEVAVAEAGLGDFHWHDLRHTFATWLGQNGNGLHVIMKALGHSKIETTMKYLHVVRSDVKAAVETLPALIDGPVISIGLDAKPRRRPSTKTATAP